MGRGVVAVDPAAEHGDGRAARFERASVRLPSMPRARPITTTAGRGELAGEGARHLGPEAEQARAPTIATAGRGEKIGIAEAAQEEPRRRIVDRGEPGGKPGSERASQRTRTPRVGRAQLVGRRRYAVNRAGRRHGRWRAHRSRQRRARGRARSFSPAPKASDTRAPRRGAREARWVIRQRRDRPRDPGHSRASRPESGRRSTARARSSSESATNAGISVTSALRPAITRPRSVVGGLAGRGPQAPRPGAGRETMRSKRSSSARESLSR